MHEEELIKQIVSEVLKKLDTGGSVHTGQPQPASDKIICNYSNRHCHVCREILDALFGKGYELTKFKDLMQPGEFASNEFITIIGPKGDTLPVRILGPVRKSTQVEISKSDSFLLKIADVPVRESGNTKGSPGAILAGPKGAYNLKEGVIIAWRHIHFTPDDARRLGINDGQMLKVCVDSGDRSLIFDKVLARVKESYALEMHIDVDEANAAGIGQMAPVTIIKD